jgi:hypothetical protein
VLSRRIQDGPGRHVSPATPGGPAGWRSGIRRVVDSAISGLSAMKASCGNNERNLAMRALAFSAGSL